MMRKKLVMGAAAAAIACSVAVANDIDPWCLEFVSLRGQAVQVTWDDPSPGSIFFRGNAGLLQMRSLDNNGLYSAGQVFSAFCADLGVQLRDVGCYEVVYPVTWPEHQGVRPNWIEGGFDRASWLVKNIGFSNDAAEMAGLQLAIWEALYDPGLDINSGVLIVNSASTAARTAANSYLAALAGSSQQGDAAWLRPVALGEGESQGLIVLVPDGGVTLLLLGLGFGGLSLIQRRARRA
jgi:hypothetical protein